ncbi:MAG: phage late control D family protein [bacterium]|nr:phage late control D family protein [bacterium]
MAENSENQSSMSAFVIEVGGQRIPEDMAVCVKEVEVVETIGSPSSFGITMANENAQWSDSNDLSEGAEVKVSLGPKDDVQELISGEITGLSPSFRKNATDMLTLRGHSQLHRLDRGVRIDAYNEKTDTDIVQEIADRAGVQLDIDEIGGEHKFTMRRDLSDYDYLMMIANSFNCKVWFKDGTIYVKKAVEAEGDEVVIEWGKTLIEFHPRLETQGLLKEVEVRGWDAANSKPLIGSASVDSLSEKIGGEELGGTTIQAGEAKAIFVDDSILDQNSADKAAEEILKDNSMNYITGSGKCGGNPKIKAGMMITLKNLGGRFSGEYLVKTVIHRYSSIGGYNTSFEVIRNAT